MAKKIPDPEIIISQPTADTTIAAVTPMVEIPEEKIETVAPQLEERVMAIDRVSRTKKGGRRLRFRATVVVGDRQGNVGIGVGKSSEISNAVTKAAAKAKKGLIAVPIVRHTIPHEVTAKFDTAKVLLKPAAIGTSIKAGGAVRPILELAGIENIIGKCLTRTTNKLNNAYATLSALQSLKDIKTVAPRYYTKRKQPAVPTPEEEKPARRSKAPRAFGDDHATP